MFGNSDDTYKAMQELEKRITNSMREAEKAIAIMQHSLNDTYPYYGDGTKKSGLISMVAKQEQETSKLKAIVAELTDYVYRDNKSDQK